MAKKKATGLGLSAGAELVTTNDRPSNISVIFRLFPSGGEKKVASHLARSGSSVLLRPQNEK